MDVIDGKWILARLTGARGEKSALAEAMGIPTHMLSKVLKGERRVQPEEIPKVIAYFDAGSQQDRDDLTRAILDRIEQLDAQERRFLLAAADGLISRRQAEDP